MGNVQPASQGWRQTHQGTRRAWNPTILLPKNAHNSRRNNRRVPKVPPSLGKEASRAHLDEEPCWKAKTSKTEKRYRERKISSSLLRISWPLASKLAYESKLWTWKGTFSESAPMSFSSSTLAILTRRSESLQDSWADSTQAEYWQYPPDSTVRLRWRG